MKPKTIIFSLIATASFIAASGQKIVVDSTSTNKYIIKQPTQTSSKKPSEDLSFSDRAISIGAGILNRLKARLNLEEASESIKTKKDKLLGKKEEEESKKSEETGKQEGG